MTGWLDVARAVTATNVVLLVVLCSVWLPNYRRVRSKHTLGMVAFAVVLLAENALALYVYLLDPVLSVWFSTAVPDPAWQAMVALHALETVALGALVWVTMD